MVEMWAEPSALALVVVYHLDEAVNGRRDRQEIMEGLLVGGGHWQC